MLQYVRDEMGSVADLTEASDPNALPGPVPAGLVERCDYGPYTEPEQRVKHYLNLCLQERLAALDFYAEVAVKSGAQFCCAFGGARTWGPQHLAKFGDVDRIFVEKARKIFPYVFWHICGHNLPQALEMVSSWDGIKTIQYDMPYYGQQLAWPEWFERVARLLKGRQCAMNSPTTQLACHGTPEQVRHMVNEFLDATTPHTTACVMPGCEIDAYAPAENVRAIIAAARGWRAPRGTEPGR